MGEPNSIRLKEERLAQFLSQLPQIERNGYPGLLPITANE